MATSLGQLFYSLSLDSKDFEAKIKALANNVGNIGGKVQIDTSTISKAMADVKTLQDAMAQLSQSVSLNITGMPKTQNIDLVATVGNASDLKTQIESALAGVVVRDVQVDTSTAKKAFDAQVWNVRVTTDQSNVRALVDKIKQVMGINKIIVKVTPDWSKTAITKLQNDLQNVVGNIPMKSIKVTVDKNYIQDQLNKMTFTANVDLKVNSTQAKSAIASAASSVSNLTTGGKDGNSITTIREENKHLTDQLGIRRSINDQMSRNTQLATMFGNVIGNVFATYQIQNFLEALVSVGGEIQKQRMALGHILQSESQASEIFNQMKGLAVKSPFGLLDLMQNARQLSAFGVQYNELYDTMKRLSDVAAGLGIQFSRIALAYGETKERGFLDGKLVRQFSYMGLPVLQKVADYYNEIHKNSQDKLFDAKQVREMVSNREVSFEDLTAVFQKMTDEGGQFANMQEVMAESVAGKWKNLSDAIDIMYSDIAEGNSGILKAPAEILTTLTRHYEELAAVLTVVATRMVSTKAATMLYASTMGKAATASWNELTASNAEKTSLELRNATLNKANMATLTRIALGKNVTAQQIKELATSKNLSIEDQRALAMKLKLNVENVRYMHSIGLITTNQKAYATSTNFLIRQYGKLSISLSFLTAQLKQAAASFAAMSLAMLTNPVTWIMAGVSAWMIWTEKTDEAERKQNELADAIARSKEEMLKSTTELSKSVGRIDVDSATTGELQTAIKDMVELIKNEAADAPSLLETVFAKDKDGNYIKDIKTRFQELLAIIEEMRGYANGNMDFTTSIQEALENADGWFDESPLENTNDFLKSQSDLLAKLSNNMLHNSEKATQALDVIKEKYHDKILEFLNLGDISKVTETQMKNLLSKNRAMLVDFVNAFNPDLKQAGWYTSFIDDTDTMLKDIITTIIESKKAINAIYSESGKSVDWNNKDIKREWEQDVKQTISVQYGDQNAMQAVELMQTLMNDPYLNSKLNIDAKTTPDAQAEELLKEGDLYKNLWLVVRRTPGTDEPDTYETLLGADAKGANDYVDAIEKVEKAAQDHYKKLHRLAKENKITLKKDNDGLYSIDSTDKTTQAWTDAKTQLNALNNELRKAKEQGLSLDYLTKEEKKTPKKSEDTWLKTTKEEFDELKKAYQEYQKWEAKVGKENAAKEINDRGLISQKVLSNYGLDIKNFANAQSYRDAIQKFYDKIKKQLKGTEREKFDLSIKAQLSEIDLSIKDEALKKAQEKVQREINNAVKQWDLYKTWFDATGDKDLSIKMSAKVTPIWDDHANDLAQKLNDKLEGKILLSNLDWSKDASMDAMKKMFQNAGEDVAPLFEEYKAIFELIWKNGEEASKQMANVFKNSDNYYQKIQVAQEQYNEQVEKARTMFTKTDDAKGVDWFDQKSFDQYVAELTRQFNQNKNKILVEGLKQSLNWDTIFGNLNNVHMETLDTIEQTLEAMVKNSKDIDPTNLKTIYELLNKVRDAKVSKEGIFGGITTARENLKEAEKYFTLLDNAGKNTPELAKALKELSNVKMSGNMTEYFKLLGSDKKYKFLINGQEEALTLAEYLNRLAQAEANVANNATLMQKNMKQFATRMQTVAKIVNNVLGAMNMDDTPLGKMISSIGGSFTGITDAISNIDFSKSFFGGGVDNVLNNMNQMSSIASSIGSMVDSFKEYEREMAKAQNEYYNSMRQNLISISEEIIDRLEKQIKTSSSSEELTKLVEEVQQEYKSQESSQISGVLEKLHQSLADYSASNTTPEGSGHHWWQGNHSVIYYMNEGQWGYSNWGDIASDLNEKFNKSYSGIDDIFNDAELTLEELEYLQNHWSMALSENNDLTELVSSLIKLKQEEEEVSVNSQLLGSTWDEYRDNFISACQDMSASASDLADNIYESLNNAIINTMFNAEFADQLQDIYNYIGEAYSSDGFSADEIAKIKADSEALSEAVAARRDELIDEGLLIDTDTSSTTSSSIQGVTEETADILSALVQGMRLDLSIQRTAVEQIRDAIGAGENTRSLNAIAEAQVLQLQQIASNTLRNAEAAETLRDTLNEVTNGTKSLSIQ